MVFWNAIRLLLENFKHTYKIMLYKLIVLLVACALACALVLPEVLAIVQSEPAVQFVDAQRSFFSALITANTSALDVAKTQVIEAVKTFADMLTQRAAGVVFATICAVLVYLLKRFADTLCYYAVGSSLNDKMITYGETPFTTALVSNLGKACIYSLVYVLATFVIDVITIALVLLICAKTGIVLALFLSSTLIMISQAGKLTATGLWMPAMTADGKTLGGAFRVGTSSERKQRVKMFAVYLETAYIVFIVNAVAALFTFGSSLLLTVPTSYFLLICLQYVYYYTVTGKKYFITLAHIESNPERGDREHIFNYIDETQLAPGSEGLESAKEAEDTAQT